MLGQQGLSRSVWRQCAALSPTEFWAKYVAREGKGFVPNKNEIPPLFFHVLKLIWPRRHVCSRSDLTLRGVCGKLVCNSPSAPSLGPSVLFQRRRPQDFLGGCPHPMGPQHWPLCSRPEAGVSRAVSPAEAPGRALPASLALVATVSLGCGASSSLCLHHQVPRLPPRKCSV